MDNNCSIILKQETFLLYPSNKDDVLFIILFSLFKLNATSCIRRNKNIL